MSLITSLGPFLDLVQLPNIQQPFIFSLDQKETKDQELNLEKALLVLKEFDLDTEYGPCIGKLTMFNRYSQDNSQDGSDDSVCRSKN